MDINAVGIVTVGRVGFSDTFHCLFEAQGRLGIPIVMNRSPFWEQSITKGIQIAIKQHNPKYLLFFDGDGIWADSDIRRLHDIIEADDS